MDKTIFKPIHTKVNYSDDCIEVIKKDKAAPDENTYLRNTLYDFHNGTIEVDVLSKLTKDAPDYARGFIGIVFRANANDSEFESFYIRPTNGMNCLDPVRMSHGCQYFSYPGYTFAYFREFGMEGYENAVDTIALEKWSHIKAEIHDNKGIFFVDHKKVLEVNGFKHGANARGAIGLYVDIGTDGFFKNLKVTCTD
ncbi:hypothetical protein [Sharpea azabuensis]|uniref:hypothetical protein n=1 Tax=Sharpea azabuensis TaxID=322505 RepID=UPI0013D91472|nr:hypothetical protein [Sharpea azabuensis]